MTDAMITTLNEIIANWVNRDSKVLDLGCGDGELLSLLEAKKNANVQGIEINEQSIYKCVERGLSVFHGDLDTGLTEYGNAVFDYVILNQTLQEVIKPDVVIKESFRVGKNVIVSFPNFATIGARFRMFFNGRVPITKSLPYSWYDTPNLHFLSIKDFIDYCDKKNIEILKTAYIGKKRAVTFFPNLFANIAVFQLQQKP